MSDQFPQRVPPLTVSAPREAATAYRTAHELLSDQSPREALDVLSPALDEDPGNTGLRSLRAWAYLQRARWGAPTRPQGCVRTSAPSAVTSSVCSNCAEGRRSRVTAVQPSSHMSHSWVPRLSIGSMVKVMPTWMTSS